VGIRVKDQEQGWMESFGLLTLMNIDNFDIEEKRLIRLVNGKQILRTIKKKIIKLITTVHVHMVMKNR
jgi:hypothetical protein